MKKIFLTTTFLLATTLSSKVLSEVTVPHIFTANTPAKAAEVNQNFTSLANNIQVNADKIASLESPALNSLLVGTWNVYSYQTQNVNVANVTFNENGTFIINSGSTSLSFTYDCMQNDTNCLKSGTWLVQHDGFMLSATTNKDSPLPMYSMFIAKRGDYLYFQRALNQIVFVKSN